MEQQQSGISFSLGTKLLISVVILLFVAVGFLDVSTIVLLGRDKRAFTFQAQATEATLVGREFVNTARHIMDTLRVSLASIDPLQPVTSQQSSALQSVLQNQSTLSALAVALVNPDTGIVRLVSRSGREAALRQIQYAENELDISPERLKTAIGGLLADGYAFFNVSKIGRAPLLAIALADLKLKNNPTGVPVAFGFLPLDSLGADRTASKLIIANKDGWVLFNSDSADFHNRASIADDPLFEAAAGSQIVSGATEYDYEGKHYLGSYTRPGLDVIVISKTDWRAVMKATYGLAEKFALLGLMVLGGAVVFAILFSKTLTAPLNRLYAATKRISEGNFEISLRSRSRDEIGALTNSFVVMSKKIEALIQESVKKAHLENELAIASTVQQTLIPPPVFDCPYVQIRSHYQAASQCGGDWWGFFGIGSKLCVLIADATGHGLPSALITASARSCFSIMHKLAQEDPEFSFSPGAMLSYANRVVHDAASGKIMMTFFAGVFDFDSQTLTYANGGHNPPWLIRSDGERMVTKSLKPTGPRLGEQRDLADFPEKTLAVSPQDLLLLYTDGLIECTNGAGEMFGKKNALRLAEGHWEMGPEAVVAALVGEFKTHVGTKPFDDDVTLAAVRVLGPSGTA